MYNARESKIVSQALAIMAAKMHRDIALTSSSVTGDYLQLTMGLYEHEVFAAVWLDNQHRLIIISELFRGTIDGAAVYPREVVKECLANNAAAVIFAHNHPSGVAEPSQADIAITRKLTAALHTIDVRVLDHLVVSSTGRTSLMERGLL